MQLYFRFVKRPGESHLALDGKTCSSCFGGFPFSAALSSVDYDATSWFSRTVSPGYLVVLRDGPRVTCWCTEERKAAPIDDCTEPGVLV